MSAESNNNDAYPMTNGGFTETDPLNENQKAPENVKEKRSFKDNVILMGKNITVEPIMVIFVMSSILSGLTTQNLNLEKACRVTLEYPDDICLRLRLQETEGMNRTYEENVQRVVATAVAWRSAIAATIPAFLALFVGSFSDRTGRRKLFLITPIIGELLQCISNMINVYYFNELSLNFLVFSDAIFQALSGGWCVMFLTMFSYISAITNERNRTFRMGLVNFSLTVGFPIGMGISGILLKKTGYYGCFGLSASLHFLNLMYTIFFVKEAPKTEDQKKFEKRGALYNVKTFFDFRNAHDTIRVIYKRAPNNRSLRICVLLLVVTILFGPMYGEMSILYLSTRYRFGWDEVKFSLFSTYNFVVHTIGTVFSITVFSKYLQWHDSVLGIISTLSKIAGSFVYSFAPNERVFFAGPVIEILNGTSLLAIRSIVSKLVEPNELGKINSIFGLTESLMPLVYVPLYTKVYTATMTSLPGAVFLMGAAMTVPAVIVFSWLLYDHRAKALSSKKYAKEAVNGE